MSDSVRPHRRQPTRLPRPRDSLGKNTGVGCHFLLQCMKVKSESEVAQSCPTLKRLQGRQPTRLLRPWDFPGKSTGVGAIAFSAHESRMYFNKEDVVHIYNGIFSSIEFNHSVVINCSVVCDSLRPHGLQHARPPCPSPTPGVYSTHVHSVGDAIQPSHLLSSPSPPAFNLSHHQGLFQSVWSFPKRKINVGKC